ncbi:MAG: hypothetical protein WD333_08550 [Dehalococcoidia bacterium]
MRILISLAVVLAAVMTACGPGTEAAAPGQGTPTPGSQQVAASQEVTPTPASYLDGDITVELRVPGEVSQGDRLTGLDVIITNEGIEPLKFFYSGNVLDFEVLNADGDIIWRQLGPYVEPLGTFNLLPGQSDVVSELNWASQGMWDLRDREGFPVDPGEYQVRGVVTVLLQDPADGGDTERLVTAAHTLTVQEAPLPDYAQALDVELIAPSEVRAGAPVPVDMRFTNNGDKPLALWWSGYNQAPRSHHLDIVIFRDDEPIWRVVDAHDIRSSGIVMLEPGETQTMSSISFVTSGNGFKGEGEPWEWDQRADCGEHRFEPCETPVAPGTYTIRGVINVSPPETLEQEAPFTPERSAIATAPHEFVITP